MPSRRLPKTDDQRSTALNTAFAKWGATAPADRAITAPDFATLSAQRDLWGPALTSRATALAAQVTATGAADPLLARVKMFVSHFIQVFNLAVARGVFPASARAFYGLDVSSDKVPPLDNRDDILRWVHQIVDGEAARLATANPGPPMAMPAVADVHDDLYFYLIAAAAQTSAKNANDTAEEAVATLRPTVDPAILDAWDDVENFYRHDDLSSLRRKAREWGVVYENAAAVPVPPPAPPAPAPPAP